ncbi:hypothetical protein FRC17_004347 [Serendipita sp. 399]|nr:hypothetical protein FRC17_004347 [Serendipita sp. 399]
MAFKEIEEAMTKLLTQWKILQQIQEICTSQAGLASASSPLTSTTPKATSDNAETLLDGNQQEILTLSDQLHDRIREYTDRMISSHPGAFRRTLSRLPNEVKVEIFAYIAADGNHHLKSLLRVDKHLHHVAVSTPSLWTTFNLSVDSSFNPSGSISASFVAACVERSKDLLLDVTISCDTIPSSREYVWAVQELAEEKVPGMTTFLRAASRALEHVEFDAENWCEYQDQFERFIATIQAITGPEGVHMRRWRSANIHLPNWENYGSVSMGVILKLFVGDSPNLKVLRLQPLDFFDKDPKPVLTGFPNLSSVQNLAIYRVFNLEKVHINFSLVQSLDILLHKGSNNLDSLAKCESLQALVLRCHISSIDGDVELRLPSLKSLKLTSNIGCLKRVTFFVPTLESLELFCQPGNYVPAVEARFVTWRYSSEWEYSSRSENPRPDTACAYLSRLVKEIRGMGTLAIRYVGSYGPEDIDKVIQERLAEQPSLQTVEYWRRTKLVKTHYRK